MENRKHGLSRIEDLQAAQAAVRFLSVEPLLEDLGTLNLDDIHWVIVGGESGRGARPMKKEWVISVRNQCRDNEIPFFFKQWGGVRKAEAGRRLEGRTYSEFPRRTEYPVLPTASCLEVAAKVESHFSVRDFIEVAALG